MDMRRFGTLLSLFLTLGSITSTNAATQTLRAANATELVSAFNIADRSGQPTIIRLATGHYVFNRNFPSPYGVSVLPP